MASTSRSTPTASIEVFTTALAKHESHKSLTVRSRSSQTTSTPSPAFCFSLAVAARASTTSLAGVMAAGVCRAFDSLCVPPAVFARVVASAPLLLPARSAALTARCPVAPSFASPRPMPLLGFSRRSLTSIGGGGGGAGGGDVCAFVEVLLLLGFGGGGGGACAFGGGLSDSDVYSRALSSRTGCLLLFL